jgi:ketosteroid isomerase-like protein
MNGNRAWAEAFAPCKDEKGQGGLPGLLSTEYAFEERARVSIRAAFLEYLAEDSTVLEPGPRPGRASYAAKDNSDRLERYPSVADIAGSDDLGFTTGPWVYTAAAGMQIHGDFLTVWKRTADCRWRIELDAGVSHAASADAPPKFAMNRPQDGPWPALEPSPTLAAADAVGSATRDFQGTAADDGFAAGLRTYARNGDFRFYAEGEAPMGLAAAVGYLTIHKIEGAWTEKSHARSADSSLAYSAGELGAANKAAYAYVEVWQYDPKVANWGVRLLLISPLPAPHSVRR